MKGLTLIEVLVGVFLILIVFLGIFGAYRLGLKVVGTSRAKITALSLANQKIEEVRNLPYQEVGTVGGVVPGVLPETETVSRNNVDYTVKTTVFYIDDSFDQLAPTDEAPNDYKRVKIKVSWSGKMAGQVLSITDVAPPGLETAVEGGVLSITVLNAQGEGVPQASVHIVNNEVNPTIDAWYQTNNDGNLTLVGAPPSIESYQITVTKEGFSTDRTYGRDEVAQPSKPHASVYEGELTEISFSIDILSSMTVQTRGTKGQGFPPIHNVTFTMTGAKIIGKDSQGSPVYKYSQDHTTNGNAEITIPDLEWDSYSFSIKSPDLDLIETDPPQPVDLLPNSSQQTRLILGTTNSLLVKVKNSEGQSIFGASVHLSNTDLGFDEQKPTDENGEAWFGPLEGATYNLEVTAEGYQPYNDQVLVSGDSTVTVTMNRL